MPIMNLRLKKKNNQTTSSSSAPPPSSAISQPVQNSSPSLGRTMMEGFSFGAGSSVAHGVIGGLFKEKKSEVINNQDKCEIFNKELTECLKQSINNEQCTQLYESYQKCLKN